MNTGRPQSRRKKFPEFSKLCRGHNYTFPEVIAKIFFGDLAAFRTIKKPYFHRICAEMAILAGIYWAGHYSQRP